MALWQLLHALILVTSVNATAAFREGCKQWATPADHPNRSLAKDNDCEVLVECRLCDATERISLAECKRTGRVERWHCGGAEKAEESTVPEQPQKESEEPYQKSAVAGSRKIYRSCYRTTAEDEFLMVRLQVICVLVGTAAFVSARKQKVLSASLFDQRKLSLDAKRRRRDSTTTPRENEMAEMEETVPLTDDLVDVV